MTTDSLIKMDRAILVYWSKKWPNLDKKVDFERMSISTNGCATFNGVCNSPKEVMSLIIYNLKLGLVTLES